MNRTNGCWLFYALKKNPKKTAESVFNLLLLTNKPQIK